MTTHAEPGDSTPPRLKHTGQPRRPPPWFWIGVGAVALLAAVLHQLFAESFPFLYDEGIHMLWIRLIEAGYAPYTQVYITYPPLYHLFLVGAWKLWPAIEGLRWLTLAYTFPTVVVSGLIARRIAGNLAGVAAALFFCLAPQFMEHSRAVMGELPSVMWSVVAVWLALVYRDSGRRVALALSGLALSVSLLTKVLSPFVVALVGFIILSRFFRLQSADEMRRQWLAGRRTLVIDLALWVTALAAPFVLTLLFLHWESVLEQVIGQRVAARAGYATDEEYWIHRAMMPGQFAAQNLWLLPLAGLGLAATFASRLKYRFTLVIWFGMALGMLFIHDPVRPKHMLILLPALSIWAGVAAGQAGHLLRTRPMATYWGRAAAALIVLVVLAYGAWLPEIIRGWQAGYEKAGVSDYERPALEFIQRVAAPDDCIITDDMPIAYWSGLLVPPELAEVSTNRLISGLLTMDQLMDITRRYDCQIVAAIANRITDYLPDYEAWVRQDYMGNFHFGEDDLFIAKSSTVPRPTHPVTAQFGETIGFLGYSLFTPSVDSGGRMPLTLYWKALRYPAVDLTIFVHLRNADNATMLTADHRPYDGYLPTTKWRPGAVIKDTSGIELPPDLPPGDYSIWVGMYRVDTMERLSVQGDISGENALRLGQITVVSGNPR